MGTHAYRFRGCPGEPSGSAGGGKAEGSRGSPVPRVLPCTVSQLRAAQQGEPLYIRGTEINQVSLVGMVRRTRPAPACVVYSLDDMTGPFLEVKQWMDLEDASISAWVIPPGSYVRVVGALRSSQQHRSVLAFSVRRVRDLNEITSHMLEVVQAHLLIGTGGTMKEEAVISTGVISPQSPNIAPGFTATQSQVLTLISCCTLPEGLSVRSLQAELRSLSLYQLRTCLNFLVNEGHVFSTIDEEHFKSTYC